MQCELPGHRVEFKQWRCKVMMGRYRHNGNLAINLVEETTGEPIATATANDGQKMPDTLVCIKDWNENQALAEALQKAGIIGPDEEDHPSPYAVYRLLVSPPTEIGPAVN